MKPKFFSLVTFRQFELPTVVCAWCLALGYWDSWWGEPTYLLPRTLQPGVGVVRLDPSDQLAARDNLFLHLFSLGLRVEGVLKPRHWHHGVATSRQGLP